MDSAFDSLDAEFGRLCADRRAGRAVVAWLVEAGVLDGDVEDGGGELRELVERLRAQSGGEGWLQVLVARAAARTVEGQWAAVAAAWAMQPAARATARSLIGFTRRDVEGRLEVAACVVAALWQVVREYSARRGLRHLAVGIAWEVRRRAIAELRRGHDEVPVGQVACDEEVRRRFLSLGEVVKGPVVVAERRELAQRARAVGLWEYLDLPGELAAAPTARVAVVEVLVGVLEAGLVGPGAVAELSGYYRETYGREQQAEPKCAGRPSATAVRQRRSRALRQVRAVAREWEVAA